MFPEVSGVFRRFPEVSGGFPEVERYEQHELSENDMTNMNDMNDSLLGSAGKGGVRSVLLASSSSGFFSWTHPIGGDTKGTGRRV